MRHVDRIMIGLLFMFASVFVLWYGSPARTGVADPLYSYGFVLLFAVGFMIGSMGLMGASDDYPALLSGFVLYFMVGALIAVFMYVSGNGVGRWTLDDADSSAFWAHWMKFVAFWPLRVVGLLDFMGYKPI